MFGRILLAFMLCYSLTISAQQYKFDRALWYETGSNKMYSSSILVNVTNNGYAMRLRNNGMQKIATIIDLAGKHYHIYEVTGSTDAAGIYSSQYQYMYSHKMKDKKPAIHKVETTAADSSKISATLTLFWNKKKKKPRHSAKLILRKHNDNLFSAVKHVIMDGLLRATDLTYADNVVLEYSEEVWDNGIKITNRLKSVETVNVVIPRPVVLIYK